MKYLHQKKLLLFIFTLSLFYSCNHKKEYSGSDNFSTTKIEINNGKWILIGDLTYPKNKDSVSLVVLFNKAFGNRTAYKKLTKQLSKKGIASLNIDLRGHGESINAGRFVPRKVPKDPIIWDAEKDIIAVQKYIVDTLPFKVKKLGVLGSSYSGEEMAEAGRIFQFADAYVTLSPGSFSNESISGIDKSKVPWFFITSKNERYLKEITKSVQKQSQNVELLIVPGKKHASDLLENNKNLTEIIAVWFKNNLK